jgi:hypothetical protein
MESGWSRCAEGMEIRCIREQFSSELSSNLVIAREHYKFAPSVPGVTVTTGASRRRWKIRAAAPGRQRPSAQRLGIVTGRLSASETTARATAAGRSAAWTVTMLMIFSVVYALMTLAARADAACSAATANSAGPRG